MSSSPFGCDFVTSLTLANVKNDSDKCDAICRNAKQVLTLKLRVNVYISRGICKFAYDNTNHFIFCRSIVFEFLQLTCHGLRQIPTMLHHKADLLLFETLTWAKALLSMHFFKYVLNPLPKQFI